MEASRTALSVSSITLKKRTMPRTAKVALFQRKPNTLTAEILLTLFSKANSIGKIKLIPSLLKLKQQLKSS
jgi:hypothetical protein